MRHTRKSLATLEARAKAAVDRSAETRVIVNHTPAAVAGEDGTGAQPATAEIWLYGTVGGYWWGFDSDDVAAALRAIGDVESVTVRLHSFGGSAIEGIAIANLLANLNAEVRIVIDGLAASAASMIALAGAELIMSPGSQLMIHDAWMCVCGNEAELRAEADWIGKQSRNYAETYAHRAGGTAESWREVMLANNGDGTWYSAQEAVDAGLASRVANIASSTPPPVIPDPAELEADDLDVAAAAEWDLEVLLHPAARAALTSARGSTTPKPPSASAVGSPITEGGSAVAFSDEQLTTMRQTLGLAENADEATIVAALGEALTERADPPAPANTTAVPEGMALVETAVLNDLREGAAAGRSAREQLDAQARDTAINAAIADGRTTPARRDHWVASWTADPEGTRTMLAALAPGLAVPVAEVGHGDQPEVDPNADAALDAFAAQLGLTKEALRG